jgi:Predicted helicase
MNPSGFFDGVSNWTQCSAALAGRTDLERGTAFEHIVRHHLRTDPIYRTKLADVWLYLEVPADVRTRLNLPSRDEGIDLIARTHTGEFWAIQAKYRSDTDAALTHRELATFTSLAFTVCREIAFALVCTTTARIPGLLQNLPHLGDLTAETWTALGLDFFTSLRNSLATPAPLALPTPRTPLPHQSRAIAAAHTHFVENAATRGKLISPCGSGKSLTACWIAEKLGARRILIAVPSLALVRQTLETWMREALATGRSADWLCVCSDDEVTDTDSAELFAHVHELGLPCDTSPAVLVAHLRAALDRSNQLVVLTTYQSSPLLASAAREAGFSFDFAVLDEAHKTTGRTRGVFAHLLHDENLPLPRRLFMTATERRFQSSSDDIVSMDDPALYGETFELLTFRDAIAATPPILSDYRILTIGVRESDVARLIEQNRWLDLGADGLDEVTATALASLIALRRATAVHGVRHTVSFHSSIARAKQFRDLCARLNAALPDTAIAAHHVNGAMGSAARQRELDLPRRRTLARHQRPLPHRGRRPPQHRLRLLRRPQRQHHRNRPSRRPRPPPRSEIQQNPRLHPPSPRRPRRRHPRRHRHQQRLQIRALRPARPRDA